MIHKYLYHIKELKFLYMTAFLSQKPEYINMYDFYVVQKHSGWFRKFEIRNCSEIVWYTFKFTIESWLKDRKLVSNLVAETTHCPETITNTFVAFSNRPSISFFIRIDLTFDYPLMILAEMEDLMTVICKDFVWT